MEPPFKFSKADTAGEHDGIHGSLRYLVHTRDLTYVTPYRLCVTLHGGTSDGTFLHLHAHYLAFCRHLAPWLHISQEFRSATHREIQLQWHGWRRGHAHNCISTTSIVFFLGNNPVTWQSQKRKTVALSCEAEHVATTTATCQGLWLARARLLSDIRDPQIDSIVQGRQIISNLPNTDSCLPWSSISVQHRSAVPLGPSVWRKAKWWSSSFLQKTNLPTYWPSLSDEFAFNNFDRALAWWM
jgi:hypothetical protein